MKLIKRTKYLELLKLIKNTQDIKIITGIRRAGKTNLMFSFLEWIKSTEDNANIVSLNLQDQENEKYLEYHELHDYIM